MIKKSKTKKQNILPEDLNLSFKFIKVQIDCNPEIYDDSDSKKIIDIINYLSKDITIDYTFVKYENSKYEKTFITEDGWNQLCEILNQTHSGTLCNKEENSIINEAYQMIIVQYIYQVLEDLGYDIANIYLEIPKDAKYIVEIKSQHFTDNYKGKWQKW